MEYLIPNIHCAILTTYINTQIKKYDIIYVSNIFETCSGDFLRFAQKTQHLLKRNGVVAHCAMREMEGIELLTDKWKIKEMLLEDRHVLCTLFRNNGR